jgi:hypothetical protein
MSLRLIPRPSPQTFGSADRGIPTVNPVVCTETLSELMTYRNHLCLRKSNPAILVEQSARIGRQLARRHVISACVELGMPQQNQNLDHTNIDVLLEQVRGEAVSKRVRRNPRRPCGRPD